jgi:dihydrofolate reductase
MVPPEVAALLKRAGVRHAYVDGGAVVSAFLAADLLDDLTVSIIPVVLGRGIRLLQGDLPGRSVSLASCRSLPGGVVQPRYRTRSPGTATR